jgi:agmatinase
MTDAPQPADTFLGVTPCDLSRLAADTDVVIFGAAEGTPHKPGEPSHAAAGPNALRRALKAAAADLTRWDFDQDGPLLPAGLRVRDAGNLATDAKTPERNRDLIRAAARTILDAAAVPVLLGGDDSVPIPFFEAFEGHGPITIVQIDAHLDWRDERNGLRHTFSSPMRRASEMPWVEKIIQVGMRGIGGSRQGDLDDARRWGARIITSAMVRRNGIRQVIDQIPDSGRCVVTVDCDGLDPGVLPAVIVPQPGGLTYPEVSDILYGVAAKGRLVGFDLVELVPDLDVRGLGALVAARLVCVALACVAGQRHPRIKQEMP